MFYSASPQTSHRQGVVLLVVVSLLTLFAIVGLSFVMYAESEAKGSQLQREAQVQFRPEIEPDLLAAFALGKVIYDDANDESGVYSALRGHSLGRSAYGWNDTVGAANIVPFNGVGRLKYQYPPDIGSPFSQLPNEQLVNYTFFRGLGDLRLRDPERLGERQGLAAYGAANAYTGGFNVPYTYPDLNNMFLAAVRGDGTVLIPSFHRDWSGFGPLDPTNWRWFRNQENSGDPDQPWLKYMVLRPRPVDQLLPGETSWPPSRPFFPPPEDAGGDVKQLVGSPGTLILNPGGTTTLVNNDSFWMDLGFPPRKTPEGKKYKPLFALLITDLDNRVNLNVHGNVRAKNRVVPDNPRYPFAYEHRSHMGWGPWEVSLNRVLNHPPTIVGPRQTYPEWANLFVGDQQRGLTGRYGKNIRPTVGETAPVGRTPHFYGEVDYDASRSQSALYRSSGQLLIPGRGGLNNFPFPITSPMSGWDNGYVNSASAEPNEQIDHPLLFDALQQRGDDRRFAISNMEALLRYGDTGSSALTSELFQLCPENFGSALAAQAQGTARRRGLVTVRSFDVDRPGVVPWLWDVPARPMTVADWNPLTWDTTEHPPQPTGNNFAFPIVLSERALPGGPNTEFGAIDWRALTASLARVNLNRPLAPYPHQGSGQRPPFGPPLTRGSQPAQIDPHGRFDTSAQIDQQYLWAQEDRQQLAREIYRVLTAVSGLAPLSTPAAPDPVEFRPYRWMAQLAVNIVDFLDEDEIATPFNFYNTADDPGVDVDATTQNDANGNGHMGARELQWPRYWVFGTEQPRLVLNEVLVETFDTRVSEQVNNTRVRTFVELHNPYSSRTSPGAPPPQTVQQHNHIPVPLQIPAGQTGTTAYAPYQIVIATRDDRASRLDPSTHNDNVFGNPRDGDVVEATQDADFAAAAAQIRVVGNQPAWDPAGTNFAAIQSPYVPAYNVGDANNPQGTILLAPPALINPQPPQDDTLARRDPIENGNNAEIPQGTPVLRFGNLEYRKTFNGGVQTDERRHHTMVLLRRLANPHLPFNPNRVNANAPNPYYNPYITIDYLDEVPLRETRDDGPVLASLGKQQPYASHRSQVRDQVPQPIGNNLAYTFGKLNSPTVNYDWLTHLDRQLVSPFELLHVSGYQPYQLTQRFITVDGVNPVRYGHHANWLDTNVDPLQSHRLFRALEFIQPGSRAAGVAPGGRVPGKININTIWDLETLEALLDEQVPNLFRIAATPDRFTQLVYQSIAGARTPQSVPTQGDQPHWGLGLGKYIADQQFSNQSGLQPSLATNTQLRGSGSHPYEWYEALNKVGNNITTRSNVFAVWVTVGFFEVIDDSVQPPKLGAEIGKAENRHVRHRMFAILDRTNLSVATGVTHLSRDVSAGSSWSGIRIPFAARQGTTPSGFAWDLTKNPTLIVDVGDRQEIVAVGAGDTITFTKEHNAGAPISLANVPGEIPWFLKVSQVRQAPGNDPRLLLLTVPADRLTNGQLRGEYDGVEWSIGPGTPLLVGSGANQEYARVDTGFGAVNLNINATPPTGQIRIRLTRDHPEPVTIANTILGNPGPQPRFNPRQAPYSGIVRYLSIIQ